MSLTGPTIEERLAELMKSAGTDEKHRQGLLGNPTEFLRRHGVEIPEELQADVTVDKDSLSLSLLPKRPAGDRELSDVDLEKASGGMKYDHNYVSKNVIDARGGSLTVMGYTATYDLNGKMTRFSHTG